MEFSSSGGVVSGVYLWGCGIELEGRRWCERDCGLPHVFIAVPMVKVGGGEPDCEVLWCWLFGCGGSFKVWLAYAKTRHQRSKPGGSDFMRGAVCR